MYFADSEKRRLAKMKSFAASLLLMVVGSIFGNAVTVKGQSAKTSDKKVKRVALQTLSFTSLSSFVADIKANLPRANTEGFVEPAAKERRIFHNAVSAVLQNDLKTARILAISVNYDLALLKDTEAHQTYVVLIERRKNFRGLGTYVFNPAFQRNLILEVPHPLFDTNTPEESTAIFQAVKARAMFISGTHRCANAQSSPCSGTTGACVPNGNQPFKVSDAGHFTRNFFQEAHRATLGLSVKPITISAHGNGDSSLPDIVLSNGTNKKESAKSLVNRLRSELKNRGVSAGSCNFSKDGNLSLCGTTNVQGRLSNGSGNACSTASKTASGLFLHIEQHLNIRNSPDKLIDALKIIIPAKSKGLRY
jgi:hypothetical protein